MRTDDPIADLERELVAGYRRERARAHLAPWRRIRVGGPALRFGALGVVMACILGTVGLIYQGEPEERSLQAADLGDAVPSAVDPGAPGPNAEPYAEPVRFRSLPPGWTQSDSGSQRITAHPGAKTWTLVTSWPYVENPRGAAHVLPENEFFMQISLLRSQFQDTAKGDLCKGVAPSGQYPNLNLQEVSFNEADRVDPGFTGLPEYRVQGSFETEYYIEIRLVVRELPASEDSLAAAERALAGLELPDWPDRC